MMHPFSSSADGIPESGFNHALNDIVLTSRNGLQVVHIDINVNGELLSSFNGDGVIFATPTGSTAYNLSAGGPIVDPKTKLILMSPLNAHVVGQRSIVLDSSAEPLRSFCAMGGKYGEVKYEPRRDGMSGESMAE